MHKIVGISVSEDLFAANKKIADENRRLLVQNDIKSFDFMGSIGAGKTMLIERLIDFIGVEKCAVIAGDVAGDEDYKRYKKHGVQTVNINTGKECHLDAHLVSGALEKINIKSIKFLFIENVGNLVCPADFPLGTDKRIVVISVTEGTDMIKKHPLIFTLADVIIINKIDLARAIEVQPEVLENDAKKLNPCAEIVITDAKHSYGIKELAQTLQMV